VTPDFTILAYQAALCALVLSISIFGSNPMRRTVWTIAAVCLIQLALAEWLWPSLWWDAAMIVVNGFAARIITYHPAGKVQALIGLSFFPQIGMHVARIAAENPDMNLYFWGLSFWAFVQLALVAGWWFHDKLGGRTRSWPWRGGHPVIDPAYRKGLG
jgi:hypothetical protein